MNLFNRWRLDGISGYTGGRSQGLMAQSNNALLDAVAGVNVANLKLQSVNLIAPRALHPVGIPIEHVYFPVSGMVSLVTTMQSGDLIETAIIGRDGAIGSWTAVDYDTSNTQSMVQVNGVSWRCTSTQFMAVYRDSELFRRVINAYQGVLMFQAQQSAGCHALHSVEARLCRWLLMSQDLLASPRIPLTQEFLSHMLGVRRASVSIAALNLQSMGLITYRRGDIQILDLQGLEELTCECYGVIRHRIREFLKSLPNHQN